MACESRSQRYADSSQPTGQNPVDHGHRVLVWQEKLIVSKTDLKGRVTYANDVFVRMSKFPMQELMGAPPA
jgi:hypothetical protein